MVKVAVLSTKIYESLLKLWLIQSGYRVAYCALMGAVLAVWH